MKNVNAKRKTESDIRIFKDWLSTVGEHRNPEYIGVEEMYMHLTINFFSARHNNRLFAPGTDMDRERLRL
jgi:hypothetical protein